MTNNGLKDDWELIVGLEVHVELGTKTKLFCGCVNQFGDEPNTNVCPVCLGLPGSLPVVNEKAVTYAMQIGRALNCSVNRLEKTESGWNLVSWGDVAHLEGLDSLDDA